MLLDRELTRGTIIDSSLINMASKRSADAMESANKKQKMPAGELTYMTGFGGHLCSEALKDALPSPQNSPQVCPYGLYAEQLSGTAFTVPRAHNQRRFAFLANHESHGLTLWQLAVPHPPGSAAWCLGTSPRSPTGL